MKAGGGEGNVVAFFGGAQVQGIGAYYYFGLHPDVGVELNRCRINSMVDSLFLKRVVTKRASVGMEEKFGRTAERRIFQ